MNPRRALFVLMLLVGAQSQAQPIVLPTVVFMSDFGVKDSAVAVCKGVMWQIKPDLRIVDLTHESPPYDIEAASRLLAQTVPFYASGTVFVAVIDPGVGSARKSIAVKTKKGHFLVGPDNGMFAAVAADEGFDGAVELKNARYFRAQVSSTFHGRDVFSPVGAYLASGVPFEDLGPRLKEIARLTVKEARIQDGAVEGRIDYVEDPYGNAVTNIPRELAEKAGIKLGDDLELRAGGKSIVLPLKKTFSDVPIGAPLAVYHSRGALSFSINQGDFAQARGIRAHDPIQVKRTSSRSNLDIIRP